MLKFKKVVSLAIAGMVAISMSTMVSAEEIAEFIKESELVFSDDYVPQSLVNFGAEFNEVAETKTRSFESENKLFDIVDIVVSKEDIIIEANTFSEFIDVFGKLKDGTYVNITNDVTCEFKDNSIAIWINGRILAEKKGKTTINLKYNGLNKQLDVKVKKQIDFEKIVKEKEINKFNDKNIVNTRTISPSVTRQSAVNTARDMVNVRWTPAKTFASWFCVTDIFNYGSWYTGIPYTKSNNQVTKDEFAKLIVTAEGCSVIPNPEYQNATMPKYGNDCSGFVSICWGLTNGSGRYRWNTTDFNNAITNGTFRKISYSQILQGDALLKPGHVILANLIDINQVIPGGGVLYSYEQVGTVAHATSYTFQQLSNAKFVAFTRF